MDVLIALCIFIKLSIVSASLDSIQASDTSRINDAAIHIIKSCLSNKIRTVGVMTSTNYFLSEITSSGLFDVTVIGDDPNLKEESQAITQNSYKLHSFVLDAFSSSDLQKSLKNLKFSKWWNYAGRFITLEHSPAVNHCNNANDFLHILWEHNIVDGIFICIDLSKEVKLFSYDPYNVQNHPTWSIHVVKFHVEYNDHPFTIVKCNFSTQASCRDVFFGLSSDLNGYPIKMNMKEYPPTAETNIDRSSQLVIQNHNFFQTKDYYYVRITARDWHNFHGVDSIMAAEYFKHHNATAIIKIYDNDEAFGAVKENGEFYGMLKDLKSGDIDLSYNNRFMLLKGDLLLTYPFQQSELTVITHPRGIQLAVLDTFQLLLGMSLPHIPSRSPPRIFLSCLILYYFIISSSVQSNMYAIVTVPQALRNVDSLSDLQYLTRKIYTNSVGAKVLGPDFHDRLEIIENDHCIDRILNKSEEGCADDIYYLKHAAARYKLHIMKEGISSSYLIHPIRGDWPLYNSLNFFNEKYNEAGILTLLWRRSVRAANDAIHNNEERYRVKKFHVMTLSKCGSIFYILLVGCCISTISLFVELQLYQYDQKNPSKSRTTPCDRIRLERIVKTNILRGCR